MARCYVRNGVWGWSLEEQEEALDAIGVLDRDQLYKDVLPEARAKSPARVRPEWLVERASMLRPTGRAAADTIYVATLLAFAVSESDLVAALTAAHERNAVVQAWDEGRIIIAPISGVYGINAAVQDWQRAKAAVRTKPGRVAGYIAAAEKKRADTKRKVKIARPLWKDTKPNRLSVEQIAEQVELSPKTLYRELYARPRKRKGTSP